MSYKVLIYVIVLFCSIFAISGINFNGFIKKNYIWEARFLSVMLIFGLTYVVSNFFIDILELISL